MKNGYYHFNEETDDDGVDVIGGVIAFEEDVFMDVVGWERFFHLIPQEQMEVLVCIYLGMKPVEIVEVLQLPNITRFYNVCMGLRKTYREQKGAVLDYN